MFQFTRRNSKPLLLLVIVGLLLSLTPHTLGQAADPEREQLLNGLKILLVSRPGDPKVLLKLRIHSGAAFDTAGKSGTMALLGDLLFPDPLTFDYFKDEIDGRLLVETSLDAIDITLEGRASEYDRIIDSLRIALVTTPLTPENVTRIRDAKVKTLSERKPTAAEVADRTVAVRLLGNYPYANDPVGTPASIARIERADLMLARERFLSPNNATLVIIGGVDQRRAMRALRQLLGGWRKSEELVPASFRQPVPPNPRTFVADFQGSQNTEVRLATRGLARGDRDYVAATLLAFVAKERWQKILPEGKAFARHEAHTLPGLFVMGATVGTSDASKSLEAARAVLKALAEAPVSADELERAKSQYLSLENKVSGNDKLADDWLNIESYSLARPGEQLRLLNSVSMADLQRIASRLFQNTAVATVAIGNVEDLKAHMNPANIQLMGEPKPKAPEAETVAAPTPPAKKRTFVFTPKPSPLIKNQKPTPLPD